MSKHIVGIDHTLIGVRDLEAARGTFERLGFTITPRGRHIGWGTANYCIMFPRGYLELLGIIDAEQFTNNLDSFLEQREGFMALALGTDDADAAKQALDARGVGFEEPRDLARLLELPEGDAKPAFKLLFPKDDALPGVSAFVCQHLTPELIRRPQWMRHANGAVGIASVTVLVDDPLALEEPYQRIFGSGNVIETDQTLVVRTGAGNILFCHPDDIGMLHPEAREVVIESLPHPIATTLRVADISATIAYFEIADVPHRVMADGTAAVRASDAHGVLFEFREVV